VDDSDGSIAAQRTGIVMFTPTLKELKAESDHRKELLLKSLGAPQVINPPTWNYFIVDASGNFQASIILPVQNTGDAYLYQGDAPYPIDANAAFQSGQSQVQGIPVVFFHQIQTSTASDFSAGLANYDLGNATSIVFKTSDTTLFARARSRLPTSAWSEWRPAPNSASTGSPATPPAGAAAGGSSAGGGGRKENIL
jgi:hypothetical protein